MKSSKEKVRKDRVEWSTSDPELKLPIRNFKKKVPVIKKSPKDGVSSSETNLTNCGSIVVLQEKVGRGDDRATGNTDSKRTTKFAKIASMKPQIQRTKKSGQACSGSGIPRLRSSFSSSDSDDSLRRELSAINDDTRRSARVIFDSRQKLLNMVQKKEAQPVDLEELCERKDILLQELDHMDAITKNMWKLFRNRLPTTTKKNTNSIHETPPSRPPISHEKKINQPVHSGTEIPSAHEPPTRSKSEIDLGRKLYESYDMQEKLVADNANLEVKRHILYKELMTKDQNLEICRGQIKRLQGELKLLHKENTTLHEKLSKNNPQGDATPNNQDNTFQQDIDNCSLNKETECVKNPVPDNQQELEEIEKEIVQLKNELDCFRFDMDSAKAGSACKGGGGLNTCFQQPAGGPPVPPMTKACGVCPPCPAPCNPNSPPTPAEKEVQKLTIQLRQTEENFKTKVTECAMLRAEVLRKKEELEKERCQHREVQNKLRELEMKFEGLAMTTNMNLGSKEQAFEQEVNVRGLKLCYREAREEIDELRMLMKEQNDQLQDYRVKYLQTQQLVEEQRRQMDMMDMDNTRISEQINLEIQKVKLKFQEKLQELAPIPDLLKAAQLKLKDAQQSQAIAEHNAEQLARELNSAREKVHMLLHSSLKPPEKATERGGDEKQIALLQQRVTQLTESNMTLKSEIERLKANIIRMEESVLANEKRLQEKMHECAQLGGELDRARDEAARALQRANERTDTIRKCMQTTVAELERQLASTRAQVKNAEKDREEVQSRMHCQIKRLNENFEQAQLRIFGLQSQVQALRRTASSTGEGDAEQQECACKTFFDNP
ncbi:GRIP and coiled-coil domain-containing protein 2-like [Pieris napi]|uniref:GRIP and coiled-coil domain-containing protein 2-like n=1 Tax=Pieris napi TaxID=78633 RepID=UPI001FB9043B|nr:GRIP and coiled-coil domain-containing protein 2-like [Pieris napi]